MFDWEICQEVQLLQEVHGKTPVFNIEDSRVWKVGKDSGYSVKSVYALLRGPFEGNSMFVSLWKTTDLPSTQVTTWKVLINSIATKVNLERRGVLVDTNICSFCRMAVESTKHMFFECKIAWLVWNQCYAWMGITSVDHVDPVSHFLHFNLLNAPVQVNVVWSSVWIVVVSEIRKHMNKHIFQGGVINLSEVFIVAQLKA